MSDTMPVALVVARKRPTIGPRGKEKPHPTIEYVQVVCPFCGKKHVHTVDPDVAASGDRASHCHQGHYVLQEQS